MTTNKSESWFANTMKSYFGGGHTRLRSRQTGYSVGCGQREPRRLRLEGLESRQVLSLTPSIELAIGADPQAITAVDLNRDGWLDLITANSGAASVSVALGNAQSGFSAANSFATGTNPGSLAVGDFNNDEKLDLATANPTSGDVTTLLGNGDGTFLSPIRTPTLDAMPMSLAAADFNQDGKLDLAVGSRYVDPYEGLEFGIVSVLYGNGNGGLFDAGWYNLGGEYPADLAIADLNRDGSPDVVTADEDWYDQFFGSGTVSVLLGNPTAPLDLESPVRFSTGIAPQAVTIGDVTGDGILDLVTAGNTVDLLRGLGGGGFAAPMRLAATGTAATAVEFGDFNDDRTLDVVTADAETGNISVFSNDGAGTFGSPLDFAAGSELAALAAADFNRDGRPDVAAARGSNIISVLLNDSSWPTPEPSVSVGDATVTEGNTGTVNAVFTVTVSRVSGVDVTVHYATADISAIASGDYTAASGVLTIPAGQLSRTFVVAVKGDRLVEPTETFAVNLSGAVNATIADGQGIGAIVDNEPWISIGNVSKKEGNGKGTTLFTFTVKLSTAYDQAVTVSYRTVNGTATTGDSDYLAKTGTLTFAPGETTKTITIEVRRDKKREANETFYVDLFDNSGNSLLNKSRGIGTILNDD